MPQPEQLPGPNADIWNWQLQGLCRGMDSSMFFHPDGERGRARTQREQRAKEMCRRCPVIEACRSHALEVGEPMAFGVACPNPSATYSSRAPWDAPRHPPHSLSRASER